MYVNTVTSVWEFKEEFRQTSLKSVTDIVEVLIDSAWMSH